MRALIIVVSLTLMPTVAQAQPLPEPPYYASNARVRALYDAYLAQYAELAALKSQPAQSADTAEILRIVRELRGLAELSVEIRSESTAGKIATTHRQANIRTAPRIAADTLAGVQPAGASGPIVSDASVVTQDNFGRIEWVRVDFATGPDGWLGIDNITATDAPAVLARAVLTWRDNSTNEAGFIVERRVGSGAWTEIGRTAANVSTFTDSSLAPGSYAYRVQAYNEAGVSGYSNTAERVVP